MISFFFLQSFFYFRHEELGEMIQFAEHIFQMGWLNHQLGGKS